ncbi:MAG: T6SS immunity protein Tdi1 domain-containing protein [Catonella sp.]|uniref:T6SS immunity protein Tdi1 domain-containing protein n=1 Tax=Lachnoanaerobaculum gingivalis TaxID=2490855 RepID=UPI0028D744DD|nr:T6SS immunity protein Tdi1 domain-containing protein [Lachnoanaerobaculum gingivalis]
MGLFDSFKKNKKSVWKKFIEKYKPDTNLIKPSEHITAACSSAGVDEQILEFMKEYGFGNYGDGIIKLIDPEKYMDSFYRWLGKEDYSRIPFMMTAFGDLFYFRNLGDGEYDISFLDIHYRKISVVAYTVDEFVEYIIDSEIEEDILRRHLFDEAKNKLGVLPLNEIYYFAPALVTGGAEEIKHVNKGDAATHQWLLFEW